MREERERIELREKRNEWKEGRKASGREGVGKREGEMRKRGKRGD